LSTHPGLAASPARRQRRPGRRSLVPGSSQLRHPLGRPTFAHDYDPMVAYGQSKTANVLFAVELDRRWADDGIRGYELHPGGIVSTSLAPWLTTNYSVSMGVIDDDGQPIVDPDNDMKTPEQGASTSVFAATSPLLAEIG